MVNLQYQTIDEQWQFDIMNLDGYDLILGTPFMFQHQILLGFNPSQVAMKSMVSLPLKGDQVTTLSSLSMDMVDAWLATLHNELQAYTLDICKTVVETLLPPLYAISHMTPLIDETKMYPWHPSKCPAPLHPSWQAKCNAYLASSCWHIKSGLNAMPMLMLQKCGKPPENHCNYVLLLIHMLTT